MADFIITLKSGNTFDLTKGEYDEYIHTSTHTGKLRPFMRYRDGRIYLEHIESVMPDEWVAPDPVETPSPVATEPKGDDEITKKREEFMKDLLAKSNCKHDETTLYVQHVKVKGKASQRYFPVCSFCGTRMRYVKAADLTDEEKYNAKDWEEVS